MSIDQQSAERRYSFIVFFFQSDIQKQIVQADKLMNTLVNLMLIKNVL